MIKNINITGIRLEVDNTTKKYVTKKIGRLDRYLPRHVRNSVKVEVKLREVNLAHGNKYEVEIIMHVPEKILKAKDTTVNILAAVDIVEAKIVTQIHKYKETTIPHVSKRGILGRFKRSYAREA